VTHPPAPPPTWDEPGPDGSLDALRGRIDEVDRALIQLLNERAKLVVDVGTLKRTTNTPTYAPHRESQVLAKVLGLNAQAGGLLPGRALEGIYREIMSGSFALERGLAVAYLGPAGSHSHVAGVKHFGTSATFDDQASIDGVFTAVARGHVECGLVPIENSIHGGVAETLEAFTTHAGTVHIYAEAQVQIHHVLASHADAAQAHTITRVYSKPEVFSQCRLWLAEKLPGAQRMPVASSSRAMQMVAEEGDQGSAAIGSELAASLCGVPVLFRNIQDRAHNLTRFFVLARQPAQRSGDDKTSVMFQTADKPGALARVLHDFERSGINLTHIDKRPAGRVGEWAYMFFVDAQGHESDPTMQLALERAKQHCAELRVLGSYPRSARIL
jgi:chorismate mutase / prephenate dehydratase